MIDIVYLWCNSSDISYINRRKKATQFLLNKNIRHNNNDIHQINYGDPPNSVYSPQIDRGELGLSLRSLYKYGIKNKNNKTKWIRNIYIVSDNGNIPYWLNINNSHIIIINSNKLIIKCIQYYLKENNLQDKIDIFHLKKYGNFNSHSIYLCLHRISSLSEIFIEMDDDFLLKSEIYLNDVYNLKYKFGINHIRNEARNKPIKSWSLLTEQLITDQICLNKKYSNKSIDIKWASHQMRVWNITKINKLWNIFPFKLLNTVNHLFRSSTDIDLTSFYPIYQYCYYNLPSFYYPLTKESILYIKSSIHFKHINHVLLSPNKQMVIQDYTYDWILNYSSINIRTLYLLFGQIFNLNPSIFEIYHTPHDCIKYNKNLFKTKIMGHRGMGYTININNKYAENTFSNFKYSYFNNSIKYIECDIALTNDNIIIVHHAHNKLWEGCKNQLNHAIINELTFKQISSNQSYWYGNHKYNSISSLREILLFFAQYNDIYFQIELKQNTNYKLGAICNIHQYFNSDKCLNRYNDHNDYLVFYLVKLLKTIHFPLNRLIISSFEAPRLSNVIKQMGYLNKPSDIRLALVTGDNHNRELTFEQSMELIDSVLHWNLTDISVFNKAVTQKFIELCELNNIYSQIGMPGGSVCIHEITKPHKGDSLGPLFKALMYNPDILCTNQPLLAQSIINNITAQCPLLRLKNS